MSSSGTRRGNAKRSCRGFRVKKSLPWIPAGLLLVLFGRVHHLNLQPLARVLAAAAGVAEAGPENGGSSQRTGAFHPPKDALPNEDVGSQPGNTSQVRDIAEGTEESSEEAIGLEIEPDQFGAYRVKGRINGREVVLLVDTGASWIAIPDRLKHDLNLQRGAYVQVATAGGVVGTYETRIERLEIGPLRFDNLQGLLNPRTQDEVILLGMNMLGRVRFEQRDGKLRIIQPRDAVSDPPKPTRRDDVPKFQRGLEECLQSGGVIDRNTLDCLEGR